MNSPDPDYMKDDDQYWAQLTKKLAQSDCIANRKFVRTVMQFSTTALDALMMNAYMMSVMADCRCVSSQVGPEKNQGELREGVLKDRRLHLIVKESETKQGSEQLYELIRPGKGDEGITKSLKDEHRLTKTTYNHVMKLVTEATKPNATENEDNNAAEMKNDGEDNQARGHTWTTAVQYLNAFVNFILWACDFANHKMTIEQVNMLIPLTEKVIRPMFEKVTNGQGRVLGLRNFVTTDKRYVGNTIDSLDQMFAEYRHLNKDNANNGDIKTKSVVVFASIVAKGKKKTSHKRKQKKKGRPPR